LIIKGKSKSIEQKMRIFYCLGTILNGFVTDVLLPQA